MNETNEQTEDRREEEHHDFDATWRTPIDDPDATYPLRVREAE